MHFGTEVVTTKDKTISALLGASPGASVCVSIVLEVAHKCMRQCINSEKSQENASRNDSTYGLDLKRISRNDEIESYQAVSTKATNDLLISGDN